MPCLLHLDVLSLEGEFMTTRKWRARLLAVAALSLTLSPARFVIAQSQPITHHLTLSNATESIDAKGRIILVGNIAGDLPGVLTLALSVRPDGTVSSGEWALNVSYVQFGPMSSDGDASESLVQLGVIKGSIRTGVAGLSANHLATALTGIQLDVTGATVQFARTTKGSGIFTGSRLDNHNAPIGSLNLTF